MSFLPSRILEVSIISAHDLAPVARCMKTYALAWIHPQCKLTTRVDNTGGTDPVWNDKFVFPVDERILYDDSSAIMIEIYALHWFKDIHVGSAQIYFSDVVSSLSEMMLLTLQIQRASGRPKGLLNITIGMVDGNMGSLPYIENEEDEEDGLRFYKRQSSFMEHEPVVPAGPMMRRTKSDSSQMIGSDPQIKANDPFMKKAGSKGVKNYEDDFAIDGEMPNMSIEKNEHSGSEELYPIRHKNPKPHGKRGNDKLGLTRHGWVGADPSGFTRKLDVYGTPMRPKVPPQSPVKPRVEYGTPLRPNGAEKQPTITDSELGPSASVVAAQIAKKRAQVGKLPESSVVSAEESSVEGLQTKLERWQVEIDQVQDAGVSTHQTNEVKIGDGGGGGAGGGGGGRGRNLKQKNAAAVANVASPKHKRRRSDGRGLFSCFSSICGLECSIVCGSDAGKKKK